MRAAHLCAYRLRIEPRRIAAASNREQRMRGARAVTFDQQANGAVRRPAHGTLRAWPVRSPSPAQRQDIIELLSSLPIALEREDLRVVHAAWLDEPIAAGFAKAQKYVLSHADAPLAWQGSHHLPDINALVALKAENGPDLIIQGSSTLYPQLLERGLLDRLTLMVAPVVLGGGKRLFGDGSPYRRLVEVKLSALGADALGSVGVAPTTSGG